MVNVNCRILLLYAVLCGIFIQGLILLICGLGSHIDPVIESRIKPAPALESQINPVCIRMIIAGTCFMTISLIGTILFIILTLNNRPEIIILCYSLLVFLVITTLFFGGFAIKIFGSKMDDEANGKGTLMINFGSIMLIESFIVAIILFVNPQQVEQVAPS